MKWVILGAWIVQTKWRDAIILLFNLSSFQKYVEWWDFNTVFQSHISLVNCVVHSRDTPSAPALNIQGLQNYIASTAIQSNSFVTCTLLQASVTMIIFKMKLDQRLLFTLLLNKTPCVPNKNLKLRLIQTPYNVRTVRSMI